MAALERSFNTFASFGILRNFRKFVKLAPCNYRMVRAGELLLSRVKVIFLVDMPNLSKLA